MGGYSWHGMHASHEPSVTSRSSSLHLADHTLLQREYKYRGIYALPRLRPTIMLRGSARKQRSRPDLGSESVTPQSAPGQHASQISKEVKDVCGHPIAQASANRLNIYQLPLKELMKKDDLKIAKYTVKLTRSGLQQKIVRFARRAVEKMHLLSPVDECTPKVLMVVGATGAGKTTLINGLANYILGVTWEDDFRFKLILETKSRSEAFSQTTWITAYNIPHIDGSRFPHPITIIDTPGFGDTSGMERDKMIAGQIKEFFSMSQKEGGIDHIDGIGFVTQASQARLTPAQNYIFQSILAIFGKDIGENIFMMTTFADGGKATVLDSVDAAGIPYVGSFKFNNSALFEKGESGFDKLFWQMGLQSFEDALDRFQEVTAKSLQLTREVLKERETLEIVIMSLQSKVQIAMHKIDELQQEQQIMKEHEQAIAANKNFTYELETYKMEKVGLPRNTCVTNCINCSFTCHYPCRVPRDDKKYNCSAMSEDGKCKVCPCKCSWDTHVNNGYRIETHTVMEVRTYEHLKQRYDQAKSGKFAKENIIKKMEVELRELHQVVLSMVQEARRSLNRLKQIALKPDPLTEVEYIEILIESEKKTGGRGSKSRIQCLEKIRDNAQLVTSIELQEYPNASWWLPASLHKQ